MTQNESADRTGNPEPPNASGFDDRAGMVS